MGKDLKLSIVIGLKDRATKGLQAIGGQVKSMSAGLTASLGSSNNLFGAVARSLDGIGMAATAVAPELGIPLMVVTTGAKAAMAGLQSLGGVIGSVFRSAHQVVTELTGRVVELGQRAFNTLKVVALVGAGLAAEAIRRSVNAFADYNQAITNAGTVTGLLGDKLEQAKAQLSEFGLAISRHMALLPTEIARGFYGLASAGLSVNEVMKASRGILTLAEATMNDVGATTELVVAAVKSFGLGFAQTDRVVNAFAAGIGASMLNMERLAVAFPYVAASASNLGISLEQTIATLGVLVDRGIDASMAGTGLRMIFQHLLNPTNEAKKALARYGLTADDVNIATKGFLPVLEKLQRAHLSVADVYKIFEARASTAFQALMSGGVQAISALEQKVTGTNRAFEMQKQQIGTAQGLWNILKSTVMELAIRFGKGLAPAFEAASKWAQKLAERIIELRIGERAGAWVANLVTNLAAFFSMIGKSASVERLVASLSRMGAAIAGEFRSIASGIDPAAIITGIIDRIARAVDWLTTNVFAPGRISGAVEYFAHLGRLALDFAGLIVAGIRYGVARLGGVQNIVATVGGYFRWLLDWGKYLVGWVYTNLPNILDTAVGVFVGIGRGLLWLADAVSGFKAVWDMVIGSLATVLLGAATAISGVFSVLVTLTQGLLHVLAPAINLIGKLTGSGMHVDTAGLDKWSAEVRKFTVDAALATRDQALKVADAATAGVDRAAAIEAMRRKLMGFEKTAGGWSQGIRTWQAQWGFQPPAMPGNVRGYLAQHTTNINVYGNGDEYLLRKIEELQRKLAREMRWAPAA